MSEGARAARVALAVIGLLGLGACNDAGTGNTCTVGTCGPGTVCSASTGRCLPVDAGVVADKGAGYQDRGAADQGSGKADLKAADRGVSPDAATPSCTDKVRNGDETDVDCGGTKCGGCEVSKACGVGGDCASGLCSTGKVCAYARSCQELHAANSAAKDGTYPIVIPGSSSATRVYCDMTRDGGGWTLVASYPEGSPAVPSGWSGSDKSVGTSFASLTALFKLADKDVNALKTAAFRVDGTASRCLSGACNVKITVFYRPACVFSSSANSADCSNSFTDLAFTKKTTAGGTNPCTWHWGLVEANCASTSTLTTQHDPSHGIVVCVGEIGTMVHGCNGRGAEKAGVKIWTK
ncbi:MAG: hypothetical protein IT371_25930 [Deltaproteobacteria bacterium]|nr:hypothetical protein [Deltaproteobacteria bacterium]